MKHRKAVMKLQKKVAAYKADNKKWQAQAKQGGLDAVLAQAYIDKNNKRIAKIEKKIEKVKADAPAFAFFSEEIASINAERHAAGTHAWGSMPR